MRPIIDEWTVVIVGSWNIAILNPDWVGREMLGLDEVEVELLIGPIRPVVKIFSPLITVVPTPSRVTISCRNPIDASLTAAEEAAGRLLQRLPLTPINAVGINFGYVEDEAIPADVSALFGIEDTDRISDLNYSIKSTNIIRQFDYDERDLNFRMTEGQDLRFHFNYHKQVSSAEIALAALAGKPVEYRAHAQLLLEQLYGMKCAEGEAA